MAELLGTESEQVSLDLLNQNREFWSFLQYNPSLLLMEEILEKPPNMYPEPCKAMG